MSNGEYQYVEVPENQPQMYPNVPMYGQQEQDITNIVSQIDPKTIIDNLDHALRGEHFNKEKGIWEMNTSKKPLVNDSCRGSVISYLDGILTNNTTMANLDEKRLSYLMESVIETITKMFVVNLEEFGFVKPGLKYRENIYENKGTPDTAKMTMVANMIYKVCYLVFTRALRGQESIRIFKSLSMIDQMGYGQQQQMKKQSWMSKLFGR